MKIKIVEGVTAFEACKNTISKIDISDFDKQNLVVVPDSFSMQAESLIFDVLNIDSTLNIEVVGISRLASKILRQNNISYQRMSQLEEIFTVFKVVKKNENNFKYFKKCDVDFCVKILQIIKQFKACKIKITQIKDIGDQHLDNKMHDLRLVYQDFENSIGEKLDLSRMLEFFTEKSKNELNLSKTNLFFVNFDSFSAEINSFICNLATQVNQVFIGYAKPKNAQANEFIYEDDIMQKTIAFAKENSINVEVESCINSLDERHLKMAQNLFAIKVKEGGKDNFFTNLISKNKKDEIEFVAKTIKNQTLKGKHFKDFAIAVADKNYFEQVKAIFSKYELTFYCDDACDLSQTVLGRFLIKILEFSKLHVGKETMQYFVSSPLTMPESPQELLKNLSYLNIEDEEEFVQICPQAKLFLQILHQLRGEKTISEFVVVLKSAMELVQQNWKKLLSQLSEKGFYKKESENAQSFELVTKTLDKLCLLGGDEQFSSGDFEELVKLAFVSVKVETIPSYLDAVFVGDATDSYFEDVDTLFVLGATTKLPKSRADNGIIDDDDIKKLKLNFVLEPEIKVINRRNRLKVFETLQHAKNKLIVSTPIAEDGKQAQKASFVDDLYKLFGKNCFFTESVEEFDLAVLSEEDRLENLIFYISNRSNLLDAYTTLRAKNKLPKKYFSALNSLLQTGLPQEKPLEISTETALAFDKKTFSASQLECFFACPFKHFLSYKLKIKESENIEPNKRLFGSFQHELLQRFVETFSDLANVENEKLKKFLDEKVPEIAKNVYHEKILKRQHFLNFLKNESEIILKNVIKEQKYTKFRPILLEEKVVLSLDEKNDMVGFVDRVDKSENYFRVLDYKTGKTENVKKDLFYGKKLQLLLYAYAIKCKTNLDCAGVYYFDCKTKYSKVNQTENMLKGLTKKDNDVVSMTDTRLWQDDFKSDLIGMSRKKSAKDDEFSFKNGNAEDDFDSLFEYAKNISTKALDEIRGGFVQAKPHKDSCVMCPYISVCKHKDVQGYRILQSIKDDDLKQ